VAGEDLFDEVPRFRIALILRWRLGDLSIVVHDSRNSGGQTSGSIKACVTSRLPSSPSVMTRSVV